MSVAITSAPANAATIAPRPRPQPSSTARMPVRSRRPSSAATTSADGQRSAQYGGDGPSANVDGGPANAPVLTSAKQGSTIIGGFFNGPANCDVRIEFFVNNPSDPEGTGRTSLGSVVVKTGPDRVAFINATFATTSPAGSKITSTATVIGGCVGAETSEFSASIVVAAADPAINAGRPFSVGNYVLSGHANDPVSTFSGELYNQLPPDIDLGGPLPLRFARYYASLLHRDGTVGTLGENWRHNFELTFSNSPTFIRIVNEVGRFIAFTNDGSGWRLTGRTDIAYQLATNGTAFVLGDPRSQRLFTFDGSGKLTQIADGQGNTHTLTYAGNQLTAVSDGLGRSLTFQYNGSGQLTNVTDGVRSAGFTQNGDALTTTIDALGFVTTYIYDPTNAVTGLLAATVLPEGNTPFTQTWNADGRVASQTEADIHVTLLAYTNLTTTVTQPTDTTIRHVHTATGELASHTDEDGNSITIASDADGRRSSVTDRRGGITRLAYHAASGKPAAITNVRRAVQRCGQHGDDAGSAKGCEGERRSDKIIEGVRGVDRTKSNDGSGGS